MKEGLSIKFNKKAVKVIKCENDIKVGHRVEADGSKIAVRGGKVISRMQVAVTQKNQGIDGRLMTPQAKLNEYRTAASEAVARKHKASRFHRKPAGAPTP